MKGQGLSRSRRVLVCLFAVGCFVAGVWLLFGIGEAFYGYWRTRDGVTVEARLRSVERRTTAGRHGTTTSTEVRYEYQFGGWSFSGSRVTLFKSSSGLYVPLASAFRAGTPIVVFVDPKQPGFSVIDRGFSWWPLAVAVPFSLVFTGVGVFVVVCTFRRAAVVRLNRECTRRTRILKGGN